MSIGFVIDKKIGILLSSWIGTISNTSLIGSFKQLIKYDPDWNPELHHIADLSEADLSEINDNTIVELADLMKNNTAKDETGEARRVALIIKQFDDIRFAKIYRSFFNQSSYNFV